ncbi:MAG: sensor histidine kinase [Pseudomonadota bacterium]
MTFQLFCVTVRQLMITHFKYVKRILLLLTFQVTLFGSAFAAGEIVPLQNGRLKVDLASYALVYADPSAQLTIKEIAASDFETRLKPIEGRLIDFGFNESRLWVVARVQNRTDEPGTWRVSHEINVTDLLRVYHVRTAPDGGQLVENILTLTNDSIFAQRPVSHRLPASDISLAPGEVASIIIEYETGQATQMPLFVETITSFNERVRFEDMIIIAPLAFAAGMAIISTLYLAALGMRAAFLYGTYILLATLHLFHADGYSFQYLWPNNPQWNAVALGPVGISIGCFGSFFTWAFIEARKQHRFFNVALPAIGVMSALFAISFPIFVNVPIFKQSVLVLVFAVSTLNLSAAIASYRRGHVGAGVFLLGMILVTSAMVLTIIGYGFPGQFNQDITGHFGRVMLLAEGVIFSLAIFVRTLALRSAHDDALMERIQLGEEKLQLSEALRSAEQSYQQASALASRDREMFASAAHDIRQPLTSLRMALMQLSKRDPSTAKQVKQSFDYLDDLVISNLDRVSEENDTMPDVKDTAIDIETFSLAVVLQNVEAMFAAEARAKGLQFRIMISEGKVSASPLDVMRVVTNLVSNAVKYTDEGGLFVGVQFHAAHVRLFVADTGIGIDPKKLDQLMEPFCQATDSQGYGLGLGVAQKLSEENGYDLSIRSALGRGTIASISLPRAPVPENVRRQSNSTDVENRSGLPNFVPGE